MPGIVTGGKRKFEGGYMVEMESDMLTIRGREKLLFPKNGPGSFENHASNYIGNNHGGMLRLGG